MRRRELSGLVCRQRYCRRNCRARRFSRFLAPAGTIVGSPVANRWRVTATLREARPHGAAARRKERAVKRSIILVLSLAALAAPTASAGGAPAALSPVQRIIAQERRRGHIAGPASPRPLKRASPPRGPRMRECAGKRLRVCPRWPDRERRQTDPPSPPRSRASVRGKQCVCACRGPGAVVRTEREYVLQPWPTG